MSKRWICFPDALEKAGCSRIYTDKASGAKQSLPGLDKALEQLRPYDTLVVWRLDRLGRSLKHLIGLVEDLNAKGIGFASLTESIDTTTSNGKLIFHIFCSLAEFERNVIRERTMAGLASARARGRKGGRTQTITEKKIAQATTLAETSNDSISDICKSLGISRSTYYKRTKSH